ncbi:MAG TPA: hypothetical protein VFO25_07535 [Candidatus Eremiobacteraceae bacterium]|nr:hypothetical protein [Candidatus Eremiobacteraceae bacterium]
MRARAFGLVCAALVVAAIASVAPSAGATKINPVIAKMIEAYGGSAVLDSIKTRVVVVSLPFQGEAATITMTYERPNRLVRVVQVPAMRITETYGFDGTRGWVRDSYGHVQEMSGSDLSTFRCQAIDPILTLLQSAAGPPVMSVRSSRATVDGKEYESLDVIEKDCPEATMLVDPATYFITKVSDTEQSANLSNYQVGSAGERYPKTVVTTSPGLGTTVETITSEQVNVAIDDSIFAMPAPGSSAAPAPGLATATPSPSPTAMASPSPTHT